MISNEDLWEATGEIPIGNQIKERKWRWIGRKLRKPDGAIEKQALEWNPQGRRKRGRPGRGPCWRRRKRQGRPGESFVGWPAVESAGESSLKPFGPI
jgi:hypothetical protein